MQIVGDPGTVRFYLNGQLRNVSGISPTQNFLTWLREESQLKGTKEGCAEGDCGACMVGVAELDGRGEVRLKNVNSCILFLPVLDGKAVFTVEYLKQEGLHPVQQAMVENHASQCGFCTPGFVMTLWALYENSSGSAGEDEIREALTGNLCRCTGYRPILDSAKAMFDYPGRRLDRQSLKADLLKISREETFRYEAGKALFFSPRSLKELYDIRQENPAAVLLAGGTDLGIHVNKLMRDYPAVIYLGNVAELNTMRESAGRLIIGAGVNLEEAFGAIGGHYAGFREVGSRFASRPIRNSGTLGGNIANGSPIGDSMPGLIALGTEIELSGPDGNRTLPLEDFYISYGKKDCKPNEIVNSISIPLKKESNFRFSTYKVSKRYDSDISAVCAAFALTLGDDDTVRECRIACGGMAATPKRAAKTEQALTGKKWNAETVAAARKALDADFAPLTDMRASAEYRSMAAANLLTRFFLETTEAETGLNVFALT